MRYLTLLCTILCTACFAQPHIMLHFDVNETLVVKNSALGESLEDMLDKSSYSEEEKEEIRVKITQWPVCKAFFDLINHLRTEERYFTIFLRSFGQALDETTEQIESTLDEEFFKQKSFFAKGKFNGYIDSPELIYFILENSPHTVIQDDISWWEEHDRNPHYGKRFFIDRNSETIQYFFDDKADRIVGPIDVETGDAIEELPDNAHIFQVDTLEVILNDNYFIEKVFPLKS